MAATPTWAPPRGGPRGKPTMPSNISAETGRPVGRVSHQPIVEIVDPRLSFSEACAIARLVAGVGYHVLPASTRVEFIQAPPGECRYCRRSNPGERCLGCGAPRMGRG